VSGIWIAPVPVGRVGRPGSRTPEGSSGPPSAARNRFTSSARSARGIERHCRDDVAYRVITANARCR